MSAPGPYPSGGDPWAIFRRAIRFWEVQNASQVSPTSRRVTGAANAQATAILKGDAGKRIVVDYVQVAVRGAAVGAADVVAVLQEQDIQDETATPPAEGTSGTNTLWLGVFATAAARGTTLSAIFPEGRRARPGSSVAVSVPALGAGAIAEILVSGWLIPERTSDV